MLSKPTRDRSRRDSMPRCCATRHDARVPGIVSGYQRSHFESCLDSFAPATPASESRVTCPWFGFDNIPETALLWPGLTTMANRCVRWARSRAADCLRHCVPWHGADDYLSDEISRAGKFRTRASRCRPKTPESENARA